MKIDGIPALPATGTALQRTQMPGLERDGQRIGGRAGGGLDFSRAVNQALGEVNDVQQDAEVMVRRFTSGEEVDLHEVLISVEKAELTFKAMMQVRNKLLDAYREIMRMNV